MRFRKHITAAVLLGLVSAATRLGAVNEAENPPTLEYQVKAAFLPKLAAFVEWPASTFAHAQEPIVLGIVGENPFGPEFERALQTQTAHGRKFLVKRLAGAGWAEPCHVLFVPSAEAKRLPEILAALKNRPTLTIGDSERFVELGGMINYIKEEGRVRFEINADAAERASLKISAKLLQVSRVFREGYWTK